MTPDCLVTYVFNNLLSKWTSSCNSKLTTEDKEYEIHYTNQNQKIGYFW